MASILESERQELIDERPKPAPQSDDAVENARKKAQNELAEEIFRDEEDEDGVYDPNDTSLSKLERDALIGQGIDFQYRGQIDDAIECYERAIKGGLKLPAAFFTVGMLYLDRNRHSEARQALETAVQYPTYQTASQTVLQQLN
jgi:tetratricopeptide (TPR) repeat protein